nr:hypothetical protein [Tanacetum cinerariifolium]
EDQLIFYKKNEVTFCEKIAVLKRDIFYKDLEISVLKRELEKLKQEKECNQLKIENFNNASKSLNKLTWSQIHDNSKKGLGYESYHTILPPPTGLFSHPKLDLSTSGLDEFKQPEFESYGPMSCEKEYKNASKDIPNKLKEYPYAPLVKDKVSDNKYCPVESRVIVEKKTDVSTIAKVEFVRPKQQEKPVRKPVKYAEMYRSQVVNAVRVNQVNVVKASAYWVWRSTKANGASIALKTFNYIDVRGRFKSVMAWFAKETNFLILDIMVRFGEMILYNLTTGL